MGFLDKKERIIDLKLTDQGRKLLSKGLLDFKFYAFSDEGIDYQTLSSKGISGSLDDTVHRNLAFEVDQRKNELGQPINNSLNTFLYTVFNREGILPKFVTNFDNDTEVEVSKYYYVGTLQDVNDFHNNTNIIKVITKVIPKKKPARHIQYLVDQIARQTEEVLLEGEFNSSGHILTEEYVTLDRFRALNVVTGFVDSIRRIKNVSTPSVSFNYLEAITGLDKKEIKFTLKDMYGAKIVKDGFLIEVFESGSDGTLKKLRRQYVKNLALDEEVKSGFSHYLDLEVDSNIEDEG